MNSTEEGTKEYLLRSSANKNKENISSIVSDFIKSYSARDDISTAWGEPVTGFAGAEHPYVLSLKKITDTDHVLPKEILPDASVVIVYFVPFTSFLAASNRERGIYASRQWALAYEETNAMFTALNAKIISEICGTGYKAVFPDEAGIFDRHELVSLWSHRHFAYAAGLGTFGLNNMLISESGCCGRCSSIVTNMPLEPDAPMDDELCIYKKNGTCGACVKACPSGALTKEGFDRHKCYEICMKNAAIYKDIGSSYQYGQEEGEDSIGSEVCGKCIAHAPCAFLSGGG